MKLKYLIISIIFSLSCSFLLPNLSLAVEEIKTSSLSGQASWYKYKGGDFAAAVDFPIGSRVEVKNISNNKIVIVTINDKGPDKIKHPERVLDLDSIAFSKIAYLGEGVINIIATPVVDNTPIKIKTEEKIEDSKIVKAAAKELDIKATAAVLIDEETGKVLWSKNSNKALPLASLTKIMAMKVFLDTKPDLNKKVVYKQQDENYNYKYCTKSESSRLRINDGETIKIKDLVYSSLIGSTNNTVETLVRVSGLTRKEFINRMNKAALKIGAKTAKFVEPTGLSTDNMVSAKDYALIVKEAFKDSVISKASVLKDYNITVYNKKKQARNHYIKNTSQLIKNSSLNIIGSKTGFLYEAGYCLMTRIKTAKGDKVIAVAMNNKTRNDSMVDVQQLFKYSAVYFNQKYKL